jgi:hypothetical protein
VGLDGIIRVNNDAIAAAEVTGGSQWHKHSIWHAVFGTL